jgi:hypothetical protein
MANLRDCGWVWEGVAFDPGVEPTIYGVGEGATYFGLDRVNFMFHPNNEITLGKLRDKREIIADISKQKYVEMRDAEGRFGNGHWFDFRIETVLAEAENLSRLSLQFPNVVGGIIDDSSVTATGQQWTGQDYLNVRAALHSANPDLRLWMVVYSHELEQSYWELAVPIVDVANLWIWNSRDIPHLPEYVDRCAEVFPGREIVVGVYIRDYPEMAPVPLDRLKLQLETIAGLLDQGRITGYSVLAACLIDQHPAQAELIREFIAAR